MHIHHGCAHAVSAASARYGVMLDEADFAAMVSDIVLAAAGDGRAALLLTRQWNGREVWLARVPAGPAVRVVYSPLSACIITVLPGNWRMGAAPE